MGEGTPSPPPSPIKGEGKEFVVNIYFWEGMCVRDEGSLQSQEGFLDDFGVEEFLSGSLLDGPAGLKHIASVRYFKGLAHILLNEENGLSQVLSVWPRP